MRLMTWNIWHHFGPWQERQVAIEQVIGHENPDVLFLQEVHTTERQAENLAAKLGYHVAVTTSPWSMGNAILSKWPIVRFGQQQLPDAASEPAHRRALFAVLDTPWGEWPVIGTHLDHRFDESHVRQLQVDAISDLVLTLRNDPTADLPVLIGGDFNAVPDSDEIRRLTGRSTVKNRNVVFADMWELKGGGEGHTWDDRNEYLALANWPNRRLDYLFVTWPRPKPMGNPIRVWLAGVEPVGGVQASDHFAVVADVHTVRSGDTGD
jgi:endonuclease/exonuclease/phosphatase family metal-dependent hydrolase